MKLYQFSSASNTTLLFWVYNQIIPFWLVFLLLLRQTNNRTRLFVFMLMLLYSPRWWMKLSVPILLAKWNDVLTMVDEKLGKKKAVELPEDWAHQLPPQRVQEKKPRKTAIETDVIPPQTTLPEDEEDYRPLDEVLEELRGK